jgi:Major Facilitator Superfamily
MDWLGVALNAALWTTFVIAVTFAGATWDWNDGRTVALLVVFSVVLIALFLQQGLSILTTPERRLFPVDFLHNRTLVLLFVATSAAGTTLLIPIYYIPLYFSFVHNNTGSEAAVRLLPFVCVVIFCQMFNGVLMPKLGYYFPWYTIAGVFLIVGGSLMYTTVDSTTSKSKIYGYSVLLAIGAGIAQQSAYSIAPSQVEPNRVSDANGFINFAQIGAIVVALTISSTVFQNVGFRYVKNALEGQGFADQEIHASLAGAKSSAFTSITGAVRVEAMEGIVKAINDAYILVIIAGVVMLICSMLMKKEKLFVETAVMADSE